MNDPSVLTVYELCIQNSFKAADWDDTALQTIPATTQQLSWFSQGFPQDTSAHKQKSNL